MGFSLKKILGGGGGGGPVNFNIPKRRTISEILQDPTLSYSEGPVGPSIEDDSAAFENFLASGEAQRRREENAATEGVLGNLNSRGLARSGIAIKDVISQVLGPSLERGGRLAAEFGLEQARRRSDLLEAERGRAADINQAKLGGRLSSILQSDAADANLQNMATEYAMNQRKEFEARRRARRGGLAGLAGGAIGGFLGGGAGSKVGYDMGSSLGI